MMMDHETCSVQLPLLVRGELPDGDRRAIEAHLAGCVDCARELTAVRALMALPEAHLTSDERRALHQAVLAPRPKRWARLAPALGAVGLLAIAAVGVTYFVGDDGDSLPAAGQIEADTAQVGEGRREGDRGEGPAHSANKAAREDTLHADTAAGTAGAGADEAFSSVEGLAVASFSRADLGPHLLLEDRDISAAAALGRVRRNAAGASAQVSECVAVVQGAYAVPLRPAYAAVYPSDELLVMGFLFEAGTEQRYAFWGWHLGDCTRPTPIYLTGAL